MRMLPVIAFMAMTGCAAPGADPTNVQPASSQSSAAVAGGSALAADNGQAAFKPPAGYKIRMEGAQKFYCKKTTVLGTRFPREVCMTQAQLKDHLATNESMRRDKDQSSRICDNPATCGFEG